MGLFGLFKSSSSKRGRFTVPSDELQYYRPLDYYTDSVPSVSNPSGGSKVIIFEERKKSTRPSDRGLYVAEILLLEYCTHGSYPHPAKGYPGFWWFEYGIQDVTAMLRSLESRGFLEPCTELETLSTHTIPTLKEILSRNGLSTSGNKAALLKRISDNLPLSSLRSYTDDPKYKLTSLGVEELSDNWYIPYMHKYQGKTTDDGFFGPICNVWEANRRLLHRPLSDQGLVVDALIQEQERFLHR